MNLTKLAEPFAPTDIEWRIGQSGKKGDTFWAKVLAYVTNRAIMQRLDDVCGPENWKNEYREWTSGEPGVLCGLSIRIADQWVTKWDGAEQTDIEKVKGGLSNAMKRAAVQWGIGRYLYDLPEGWAMVSDRGQHFAKTKDGTFKWDPPNLPKWALPEPPEPETSPTGKLTILHTPSNGKDYWHLDGDTSVYELLLKRKGWKKRKNGTWYTDSRVIADALAVSIGEKLSDFPQALGETDEEKAFAERIGAE